MPPAVDRFLSRPFASESDYGLMRRLLVEVLALAGPPVYATIFSGFYLPLMLVLFALIFRAVSIEFGAREASPAGRARWDIAFALGSTLAVVLFVVLMSTGSPIVDRITDRFDETRSEGTEDTSLVDRYWFQYEVAPDALRDLDGSGMGATSYWNQ